MRKKCNIGVILAGGKGLRAGKMLPKQYCSVKGRMIIDYVYEAFELSDSIDIIIIAADKDYFDYFRKYDCICIEGGKERNDTVRNVLDYIIDNEIDCEKILFHDSARPCIESNYINECMEQLNKNDAVITTAKITDSLGKNKSGAIDRTDYYLIQTPEAFIFSKLEKCFSRQSQWTAIVQQLPKEASVFCNYSMGKNLKITYPEDFKYFEFILDNKGE